MANAPCPECQHLIDVGAIPDIGLKVHCPICHLDLEVVWLFPVCLDNVETNLPKPTNELLPASSS